MHRIPSVSSSTESAPRIIDDRVMLPVRAVFEAMGMTVDWDEATQTAIGIKGHRRIFLTLGSATAWVNDLPYTLDVPPQTVDLPGGGTGKGPRSAA